MKLEELGREITELAAHIQAATCRWLLLVADFDEQDGWGGPGFKSCAHWLQFHCSIAPGPAREHVRVARRLKELPLVSEAFARGELSYSKVRAITRLENIENEAEILSMALDASAAQLERIIRSFRSTVALNADHDRTHERRYLGWYTDEHGGLIVRGYLPAEAGAAFVAALNAAVRVGDVRQAPLEQPSEGEELVLSGDPRQIAELRSEQRPPVCASPEPFSARRADALCLMAENFAAGELYDRAAAERTQVVVHVDAQALVEPGQEIPGRCELEDGPAIAPETARRLCCDSSLVRVIEQDGRALSVGRKRRSVNTALRRALRDRDKGCRFPGCEHTHGVEAHHIEHWAKGGETKLSNLVVLCAYHHRLVHEGGYRVERSRGNALHFIRPDGRRIGRHPKRHRGDHHTIITNNHRRGTPITPTSLRPREYHTDYDLGYAVDAIYEYAPPDPESPGV